MAERKLTDAEQRRLSRFTGISEDLVSQGYKRTDLDISIVRANVAAIVATILLFAVSGLLFHIIHPETSLFVPLLEFIDYFVAFIVLIVVHELIHGLTWSCFTPNGFKDIEFGIMQDSKTPYCACLVPLRRAPYVLGALMPLVTLGIAPMVVALCMGNVALLYLGIFMTTAAVGDVMVVAKVLRYKPKSDDMLLFDHPIEAGSVVFDR